jgi:hypothetical protein
VPDDVPGVPARTSDGGGDGRGRSRKRKRRALLWSTVAAAVAGAAVAGTLYVTAYEGEATDDAAPSPGATTAPPYKPPPVPEGYHLVHDERRGVAFPVPDGWKAATKTPDEVKSPHESGGTTRRSTASPLVVRTDVFFSPCAMTSETYGSSVNARISRAELPAAASTSMSPIVSRKRRSEPAQVHRRQPVTRDSSATMSSARSVATSSRTRSPED